MADDETKPEATKPHASRATKPHADAPEGADDTFRPLTGDFPDNNPEPPTGERDTFTT